MKTKLKFMSFAILFILASCKKEEVLDKPGEINTTPSAEKLNSFFQGNLISLKQTFSLDASIGGTILGNKGTVITIQANSLLNSSGQIVNGNVSVELIEIFDRKNMILANKPTMGKLPDGTFAPLLSGGEYYLNITQNGQKLNTSYGVYVQVPTNSPNSSMSIFSGNLDAFNDITWDLLSDSIAIVQDTNSGGNESFYYSFYDNSWSWVNCDYFYSNPDPKTTYSVNLPSEFNDANCNVYLTLDGLENVVAQLYLNGDNYSISNIPIGMNVHFLAISNVNDEIKFASQGVIVSENLTSNVSSLATITEADLENLINNLP